MRGKFEVFVSLTTGGISALLQLYFFDWQKLIFRRALSFLPW